MTSEARGGAKSVLIVDDDHAVRELAGTALRRAGFDVTFAPNGRTGIERFCSMSERFDLILMDYRMPEMDGLSACRVIRDCAPDTPIVIMSTEGVGEAALSAGATAFLAKPVLAHDLIDCVTRHIDTDAPS